MFAYLINVGVSFHSFNLISLHLRLLRELSLQLIVESLHRDVVGEKIHAVIQFFNAESAQAYGAFVGAEGAAEDRQTLYSDVQCGGRGGVEHDESFVERVNLFDLGLKL